MAKYKYVIRYEIKHYDYSGPVAKRYTFGKYRFYFTAWLNKMSCIWLFVKLLDYPNYRFWIEKSSYRLSKDDQIDSRIGQITKELLEMASANLTK